ncbi:MAG TPA: hypothetical protein VM933_09780 [Acidimicrobiales bacterium]|nr:hypothetical protein [Acidimicrobiales bacterium]
MRRFLAVWPPSSVAAALSPLARGVPAERLHVTLRFLGDAPFEGWPAAPAPAGVEARLGPRTDAFGRRVLHVPVAGLDALAALLDPRPERPFVGHLTLGRGRDVRPWVGVVVPAAAQVRWPVEDVTLVRSEGGRYVVEERWPLPSR